MRMQKNFSWPWIETQTTRTIDAWRGCFASTPHGGPLYCADEQQRREKAYDEIIESIEREAKMLPPTRTARLAAQERMTSSLTRLLVDALDFEDGAAQLLTDDFLSVGTKLASSARNFDENLSMAEIIQATRNAWIACSLQLLLGKSAELTPAILGYSLLYPYTDNFLDRADLCVDEKHRFSGRLKARLGGEDISAATEQEATIWTLVSLIEEQFPRERYTQVFDCLLAIHRAQEDSIAQLEDSIGDTDLLRISCAKGGSSVLADACLVRGWLTEQESRFSFAWGMLLQLGDDLQDVREDLQRGSVTLFSRAAASGVPLDALALQLLSFSDQVVRDMDDLPRTGEMLKRLLRTNWRSLIVGAIADSHEFFSPEFVEEMERSSPLRFDFLRSRRSREAGWDGLYTTLFNAFIESPSDALEHPSGAAALKL